jgi:ABC-2 type transport system ATP-binding protein
MTDPDDRDRGDEPVLVVDELTKVYPGRPATTAVDRLSFALGRREVLGLLGPNGAGKTTTIQMLLSTLEPTSGEIRYFGESLAGHRAEILAQVGFASAYSRLPRRLTVAENLDVFGRLYGLKAGERRARVRELLERFGAWDLQGRSMEGLSAGQTTRVMLAKAFLARPKVALLDEPTASLDPDIAAEVRAFVRSRRDEEGVSIVFTSHNMDEVAQLCDRVIFLDRGRIASSGRPEDLAASAAATRVRFRVTHGMPQLLDHVDSAGLPRSLDDGVVEVEIDEGRLSDFLAALAAAGVRYREIALRKPTLEDYFLKLAARAAASRPGAASPARDDASGGDRP